MRLGFLRPHQLSYICLSTGTAGARRSGGIAAASRRHRSGIAAASRRHLFLRGIAAASMCVCVRVQLEQTPGCDRPPARQTNLSRPTLPNSPGCSTRAGGGSRSTCQASGGVRWRPGHVRAASQWRPDGVRAASERRPSGVPVASQRRQRSVPAASTGVPPRHPRQPRQSEGLSNPMTAGARYC